MKTSIWEGCYDENLKSLITPESFAHPAKMAKKLCERIFEYGEAQGYWKPGDVIIDPFGGIGTTGLIGAYRGYRVISIELEPHFVEMQCANIGRNARKLQRLGKPLPVVVQGDARVMSQLIRETIGSIFSPPYAEGSAHTGGDDPHPERMTGGTFHGVGLNGAISSPPYAESIHDGNGIDASKLTGNIPGQHSQAFAEGYGATAGQIGALREGEFESVVADTAGHTMADTAGHTMADTAGHAMGAVTSPPWGDGLSNDRVDPDERVKLAREMGISNAEHVSAIDMEKIGKRARGYVEGAVTSPPYEGSFSNGVENTEARKERTDGFEQGMKVFQYGHNPNTFLSKDPSGLNNQARHEIAVSNPQIGAQNGETYWQAMRQVYAELYAVLKPGGVVAIVVKDFVRNKQIVPLCDMTARLLEAVGFMVIERTRAMLVKETHAGIDMFSGESVTRRTERKSFFRRLAEKNGSPRIDYEEVIWARK